MSEIKSLREIVESLLECNYECEAGPLKNNKDFRLLAKMAGVELPKSVGEGVVDLKKAFENMAHSIANILSYTPDQQRRDEIVAKAEWDVEDLKTARNLLGVRGYPYKDKFVTFADFIVNKDKRTVVALLRFQDEREVLSRGIAKCHPNDCFNVHIGKAIALRRALGLDVPDEYLNAPQPTEVRVGDVVEMQFESFFTKKLVTDKINPINVCETTLESAAKYFAEGMAKIIDDSRDDREV